MKLSELRIVDLYIGHDYCDYTADPGSDAPRNEVPADCATDVELLRTVCRERYGSDEQPEFGVEHDGASYRVTATMDVHKKPVFVLNRASATVRRTVSLGYPAYLRNLILSPDTQGLIVFAGSPSSGKTSAAASFLVERLTTHGGRAWAIEDPPEIMLDGLHGQGRCTQVPVSRKQGGYREQLIRAMRARIKTILIGEIRDAPTAAEVVLASSNGHLILTTIHSDSIPGAIRRLIELADSGVANAAGMLADGLVAVVHQRLVRAEGDSMRMVASTLSLREPAENRDAIKTKIREGRFEQLGQDIDDQAKRATWK